MKKQKGRERANDERERRGEEGKQNVSLGVCLGFGVLWVRVCGVWLFEGENNKGAV